MKRLILFLIICDLLLSICSVFADTGKAPQEPVPSGPYFFSEATGYLPLTRLDPACVWDQTTDRKLQVAGTCGQPAKHNKYQVLAHNRDCDPITGCPGLRWGGYDGINAGIAELRVGDIVQLFDGEQRRYGVVVAAFQVLNGSPSPQDEFECGNLCGTAATSFGTWPNMGYWLVRIRYQ